MDKRSYNERVFAYSKERFSDDSRRKLLVVGDSFARDFVNITLEGADHSEMAEIIYRNDLFDCIHSSQGNTAKLLFGEADFIVFATMGAEYDKCAPPDIDWAVSRGKQIYYVGPKDFGYNINWLRWLNVAERRSQYNRISDEYILTDARLNNLIPRGHYISLLAPVLRGSALRGSAEVPITDSDGVLLSTDLKHLTKYGAIFFWEKAVRFSSYAGVLK
jgi:hypothetical protein